MQIRKAEIGRRKNSGSGSPSTGSGTVAVAVAECQFYQPRVSARGRRAHNANSEGGRIAAVAVGSGSQGTIFISLVVAELVEASAGGSSALKTG